MTMESKISITKRLQQEGRWEEASAFKDAERARLRAEGMTKREAGEQAWQAMAERFPPLPKPEPVVEPLPMPNAEPVPATEIDPVAATEPDKFAVVADTEVFQDEAFDDNDGSYVATLNWTATALGWLSEGRPVSRLDAPGPQAWAIFQWAGQDDKTQEKFWGMWVQASKRTTEERGGEAEESRRQVAELQAMLDDIHAENAAIMLVDRSTLLRDVLADPTISPDWLEGLAAEKRSTLLGGVIGGS